MCHCIVFIVNRGCFGWVDPNLQVTTVTGSWAPPCMQSPESKALLQALSYAALQLAFTFYLLTLLLVHHHLLELQGAYIGLGSSAFSKGFSCGRCVKIQWWVARLSWLLLSLMRVNCQAGVCCASQSSDAMHSRRA